MSQLSWRRYDIIEKVQYMADVLNRTNKGRNMQVTLMKTSNLTHEERINTVTEIAAISRGKDNANNPAKRFQSLMKEAMPNYDVETLESREVNDAGLSMAKVAGRPLEFLPVKLCSYIGGNGSVILRSADTKDFITEVTMYDFLNKISRFSYIDEDNILYTNARALLNAGIPMETIPYGETIGYTAVKVKAPYFSFAQIRTHGVMSQIAVSERMVEVDEMWYPDDILDRVEKHNDYLSTTIKAKVNKDTMATTLTEIFRTFSTRHVQHYLKELGYDKEIWQRYPNHLKMKEWIIGGWVQDPKAWGHLLLERSAYPEHSTNWTQKTTAEIAEMIRVMVNVKRKGEEHD